MAADECLEDAVPAEGDERTVIGVRLVVLGGVSHEAVVEALGEIS